ncbi:MAG: GFA family protein [Myxococcota bacterium]
MTTPHDGRCTCGHVRFRLHVDPMFVHACHCTWCQRETGAAFAWNAMVEADQVELLGGEVERVDTPSASGRGQVVARCPQCRIAVWSNYGGRGDIVRFVRVGALEDPSRCPPDAHIFVSTKARWLALPEGARAFDEFYDRAAVWPEVSQQRLRDVMARHAPRK